MGMAMDNLATRMGAVLLVGLIALQLTIGLVVLWPDDRLPVYRLAAPAEAAAMARVLEAAPPALQPAILGALSNDTTIVHLAPDFPPEPVGGGGRAAAWLERRFAPYADELAGRPFRVQAQGVIARGLFNGRVEAEGPVRLLVRLRTGQVLVIERTPGALFQRFRARAAAIAVSAVVILLLVLIIAVRQTARPVNVLAGAARRFAGDLASPDLPVQGAHELKELSIAFNDMKRTIRGLIDDRTRILAAVAHDLRTYLTRLRLRTEFIADVDQRDRAVADLEEMSLLLDDTLTFAREATGAGASERPMVDVANEAAVLVAVRVELGEPVSAIEAAETPLLAVCAPLALRRMLANLVDNAVRYGVVARLRAWREGGEVRVAVEDDGPGVPPDALMRLTAPFERLEPSRGRRTGGAGLGLAIVKALAESQGGRLHLENRPQGGLCATIILPAATDQA